MTIASTLLYLFTTSPLHANSIRLHDQAGSNDRNIQLSEIAELEGADAEAYADLIVATFDEGAKSLTLDLPALRLKLTEADANWATLSLKGYAACEVFHTPGGDSQPQPAVRDDRAIAVNGGIVVAEHAAATVRGLLRSKIAELANADLDSLKISFSDRPSDSQWLDRSALVGRYELQPLSRTGLGRVPIKVRRFDDSGMFEQTTLTAEVSRRLTAVVATRSIRRGEVFTKENTAVREVFVTADHGPILDDTSLVLGQSSGSMLREGAIVLPKHIAAEVMIKRGDLVTVTCISGSLVVRTAARASAEGSLGQLITLRNEQTRETFQATVTARREATITQPASPEIQENK